MQCFRYIFQINQQEHNIYVDQFNFRHCSMNSTVQVSTLQSVIHSLFATMLQSLVQSKSIQVSKFEPQQYTNVVQLTYLFHYYFKGETQTVESYVHRIILRKIKCVDVQPSSDTSFTSSTYSLFKHTKHSSRCYRTASPLDILFLLFSSGLESVSNLY